MVGSPPVALVGSKAARLVRLRRMGLPVPPGAVLSTAALQRAVDAAGSRGSLDAAALALASGDGERAKEAGGRAAAELLALPIPKEQRRAMAEAYGHLIALDPGSQIAPLPRFAVRSSACGEDGADRSHAGQYESVLEVAGLDAIWDAVRQVWASWYSERAIHYRLRVQAEAAALRSGLAPVPSSELPPMAVLVQRMVEARASGILFTVNPVSGSAREIHVEAGPGLGEQLAQGRILPDYFLVQRLSRRRELSGHGLDEDGRHLRILERAVVHEPPSVSEDEVIELCRIGLRVEREFGYPVDIEWTVDASGRLFLVQARPITALRREPPEALDPLQRPPLWTQRFCGERWTDQATPLGWSLVQPALHHFTHWEGASTRFLDGTEPTRLFRGRPYFNITLFRHLVFRLPGMSPPRFVLEMFPEREQQEMRRRAPHLPNLPAVGSILGQVLMERRWERYRWNVLTNHAQWEAFRPGFEAQIEALSLEFSSPEQALPVLDAACSLMRRYLSIHLLSLLFAHLSYEALDKALRSWAGEGGEALRSALVSSPGENLTLRCNEALWALACELRRHPAITAALLAGESVPSLDSLLTLEGGAAFGEHVRRFLDAYGHRSAASWEIFATRWADDPELVLRMVASYLRGGMRGAPQERQRQRRREREQAEALVRARMGRTLARRLVPWRQRIFAELLSITRSYIALRENQRFSFDRLLLRMKRVLERLGAILERDGLLPGGDDLVFLQWPEVQALVRGGLRPEDAGSAARARRAEFERNRRRSHPDFLVGEDPVIQGPSVGAELHGLGISPGQVSGVVRVLHSLDDMEKLRPGDILVARATDPGWTPLFLTAGGLVLELGSVLSHGAVVAREYRLPAVVNVEGATRLLRDGMQVTIDGDQGTVEVHRVRMDPAPQARTVRNQDLDA